MTGIVAAIVGMSKGSSSSGTVFLSSLTINSAGNGNQTAGFQLSVDGKAYSNRTGYGSTYRYDWLVGGVPSDYEIRTTDVDAGSVGPWVNLVSGAGWSVTDPSPDFSPELVNLYLEIRDTATSTVRATCNITLYATRNN